MTTYSDCHEYHAESTVRFDEPSLVEPAGKGSGVPGAPLPAGLKIRLAIETPIDTNIAAAGDVFTAKVLEPVRAGHSKETIMPAGAIVRGRIVAWTTSSAEYRNRWCGIAVLRDAGSQRGIRGCPKNCWAKPGRCSRVAAPSGQPPNVGVFFFPTSKSRFIVPRGEESDWITATPK